GECGVLPTSNREMKPNWQLWYDNFFANCDIYGYVPLLWDTGNMLDRTTHKWINEDVKKFLLDNSYDSQKDKSYEDLRKAAEQRMSDGLAKAPETFDTSQKLAGDGTAIAWIMWDSMDWNIVYSVGDTYDPDSKTGGIKATDVEVTGEGTYTIGLDFTGTDAGKSVGTAFSAIGIANGEELFPGYVIVIKEILINNKPYTMKGRNYTSSDDGLCTRSNLYNEWVPAVPDDARTQGGGKTGCTPTVLEKECGDIETLQITFDYLPGAEGVSEHDANSKN
ncbi:MAG: glycoside hydrolase family 5 protein, partial [Eubacterium sp.]|nr:glycoside hydrolase family 5 protein [Eubacterium sp.]